MIICFRFSFFLFKIQIILIKISKQEVISFFLDRYWLRYGPSKRFKYKNPKKGLFKIFIWNLVFDFFQKINFEVHNQSKNTILTYFDIIYMHNCDCDLDRSAISNSYPYLFGRNHIKCIHIFILGISINNLHLTL